MAILVDREISSRIASSSLASNVDPTDNKAKNSPIQAASLDLTIGEIYIPGTEDEKPGGVKNALTDTTLGQGHTAVIRTREILTVSNDLAAIAFPPASMSLKGLLTTNPGHIDPGYKGALHLTVINMGKAPIALKAGERIMRVLFIDLNGKQPDTPYGDRNPSSAASNTITSDLLTRRLSEDFLDIERRAKQIAKSTVRSAQIWAAVIPIVVTILTVGGTLWVSRDNGVAPLAERVAKVEAAQAKDDRFEKMEAEIAALKEGRPKQ